MSDPTKESHTVDMDIVNNVGEYIDKRDPYIDYIEDILEYEDEHDKDWDPYNNIGMQPYHIGEFKSADFIDVVLDSNNNTYLELEDRESTRFAVMQHKKENQYEEETEKAMAGTFENISVTDEERDEIIELTEDHDALEFWSKFIAPTLKHRPLAKKATLIMLSSPEDKHGTKGRVNLLIYGPPGTGKTVIKNHLKEEFGAETIDGPRVSKVDLTYNKNTGDDGQLVRAHKGIAVIEEADEMDEKPLGAALTSLGESGKVEIQDKELDAEVRGVMLGNFETKQEIINHWSPESLNRFDFVLKFDMLTEDEKDSTLDWHYEYFRKPSPGEDDDMFKKYIKVVREFDPEIEDLEDIKDYKAENIDRIDNIREGISVMNVAWTIARINLEDVTLEHYKQAVELVCGERNVLAEHFGSN